MFNHLTATEIIDKVDASLEKDSYIGYPNRRILYPWTPDGDGRISLFAESDAVLVLRLEYHEGLTIDSFRVIERRNYGWQYPGGEKENSLGATELWLKRVKQI